MSGSVTTSINNICSSLHEFLDLYETQPIMSDNAMYVATYKTKVCLCADLICTVINVG